MCKNFHSYSMCAHVIPSETCAAAHITRFKDLYGADKVIVVPCHLELSSGGSIPDTCPACTKMMHGCGHPWVYNNNRRQFEGVTVEPRTEYVKQDGKCPECLVKGMEGQRCSGSTI